MASKADNRAPSESDVDKKEGTMNSHEKIEEDDNNFSHDKGVNVPEKRILPTTKEI